MKVNDRKPSKELLKKWDDMTNANFHGEVRLEIAEWMGNYGYIGYFRKYIQVRDTEHGISNEYFEEYCNKSHEMIADIAKEYGEETARAIGKCL